MLTNVLIWIFFGALTGWVASLLTEKQRGSRVLIYILIGIVGAIIGGLLLRTILDPSVSDIYLNSLLLSIPVAILLLGLYEMRLGK